MKLYFKPAELELADDSEGVFVLRMAGDVVATFAKPKPALEAYNRLRRELETKFPVSEPSAEERAELLRQLVAESLVQHNSFKAPEKKTASRKSRTFG